MTLPIIWSNSPPCAEAATESTRHLTEADLRVVFQPIVHARTGSLFAYEALARCQVPGLESPAILFQRAEAEQTCGRLGRIIRNVAFETAPGVPLFVNIHPDELVSHWLVRPDDPLGFHVNTVYLEITESAALSHFQMCLDVLKELCRRTDARLVVDDFGAGHSNLQRVVDLEPAVVKLDLALTRGIDRDKRRQIVVRHVVMLCRELGAAVVAEGVETIDELICVADQGVDWVQGYLLGKPAYPAPPVAWPFGPGSGVRPRRHPSISQLPTVRPVLP